MLTIVHPDIHLLLVTAVCLLLAWGPVLAAIGWGLAKGLAGKKRESAGAETDPGETVRRRRDEPPGKRTA